MPRYSETVMDHFLCPRNAGAMENPDVVGEIGVRGEGRLLVLYLRFSQNRVVEAKYECFGCGCTIAAGSMLTELVTRSSVEDCRSLTPEQLIEALDGLPPDKVHCAEFAIGALRQALDAL